MTKLVKNLLNEALTGKKRHAGVLIQAKNTNRFLLLKRAGIPHKGTWSLLSGGINPNEEPLEGIKREVNEEIQINPELINFKFINIEKSEKADFYYFKGIVEKEFIPKLDFENLAWIWITSNELPQPLYPNLDKKIKDF